MSKSSLAVAYAIKRKSSAKRSPTMPLEEKDMTPLEASEGFLSDEMPVPTRADRVASIITNMRRRNLGSKQP